MLNYLDQESFSSVNAHNNIISIDSCSNKEQSHQSNGCVFYAPSYLSFRPKKSANSSQRRKSSVINLDLNASQEGQDNDLVNNESSILLSSDNYTNIKRKQNLTENIDDNKIRKKSLPANIIFNRKQSTDSQLAPYTVKRKFSLGQIKVINKF